MRLDQEGVGLVGARRRFRSERVDETPSCNIGGLKLEFHEYWFDPLSRPIRSQRGGSSGIGSTAIQVAKAWGATVITTAGSDAKVDYCRRMGADHAINYRDGDWEAQVKDLSKPRGVDVVLDMVAGPYVMKNLRVLGNDGRYAMIAFLLGSTTEVNFAYLLPKRLTITGSTLRPQPNERKAAITRAVEADFWPLVASGKLSSHIHARFPLNAAVEAHRLMESSEHMGKLVLEVKR